MLAPCLLWHQQRHLVRCQELVAIGADDHQVLVQGRHNVPLCVQEADCQDGLQQMQRALQPLVPVKDLQAVGVAEGVLLGLWARQCCMTVCKDGTGRTVVGTQQGVVGL